MNTIQLDALTSMFDENYIDNGLICPTCEGEEHIDCDQCDSVESGVCSKCDGDTTVECPTCDGTPHFEIMWNTLFEFPHYALSMDLEEARKTVFSGWAIIEDPNGDYWFAAGSCGYDFTWVRGEALMEVCENLPYEYADSLSRGGYCFVSKEWRIKLAKAAAERLNLKAARMIQDAVQMTQIAEQD